MPTALMRLYDGSGIKMFDTTEASGGCVADVVKETSTSQTKSYPSFAGRTAFVIPTSGWNSASPTISYSSGYPSITYPPYIYSHAAVHWVTVVV